MREQSTIKKAAKYYLDKNIPPISRLRRSSRNPRIEELYTNKFNIENYALYRKKEIDFIVNYKNFYINKRKIILYLNYLCPIYNEDNSQDLLDIYLMPLINDYSFSSMNIIKYSLSINPYLNENFNKIIYTSDKRLSKSIINQKLLSIFYDNEIQQICMTGAYSSMAHPERVRELILASERSEALLEGLWFSLNNKKNVNLSYLYNIIDI